MSVADTAFLVAAFRARETERPDALFHDPLAARLEGEKGRAMLAALPGMGGLAGWSVVVRTPVVDELVLKAVGDGARAVLNLGAGLDTRPYRLPLPAGLRWVEVDLPATLAWKEERLAGEVAACRVERVARDLLDGDGRRALLAGCREPTVVLTEGVVPYLAPDDVGALADDLRGCPAVTSWIVDWFAPELVRFRNASPRPGDVPLRFDVDDWQAFFLARGWRVAETRSLPEEGERLGRPFPVAMPGAKAFTGYAVLVPA